MIVMGFAGKDDQLPFEQVVPRPFAAATVQMYAPALSGVYGISNSREWIYIGQTDNIRASLMRHLGRRDGLPGGALRLGFVFEVCDEAGRSARQDRLIFEYEPVGNRRPPRSH